MVTQSAPVGKRSLSTSGPDGRDETAAELVHGTAVRFSGKGLLLLGPSTSGKSDLALRLIDAGGTLIADDQVRLRHAGNRLHASPPDRLQGLIELRGMGIMRVPFDVGELDLVIDLLPPGSATDPLPEPATSSWFGVTLPRVALDARAPSAVAKMRMILTAERVF